MPANKDFKRLVRGRDRLDVEEDERHQGEHAMEVALVERDQTRPNGSEAGQ